MFFFLFSTESALSYSLYINSDCSLKLFSNDLRTAHSDIYFDPSENGRNINCQVLEASPANLSVLCLRTPLGPLQEITLTKKGGFFVVFVKLEVV